MTPDSSVLILIFNRPDKVKALIQALSVIQPKRIFIAADGPRVGNASDTERCAEARKIALEIPWECEVVTRFSDANYGCRYGITDAIDWFFEQVEEGIILEDDCIPDPTFFSFCAELLERYRDDERVMHISGNNFQDGQVRGDGSYYFSAYTHSWGWATWRRAWQLYSPTIATFTAADARSAVESTPLSKGARRFWLKNFNATVSKTDSWDSLWLYVVWKHGGLSILPNRNLVSNIGFDSEGTHTIEPTSQANVPAESIAEIAHPTSKETDYAADEYTFRTIFYQPLLSRISHKISAIIGKIVP